MNPAIQSTSKIFWPTQNSHVFETARFGRSTTTCQDPRRTCECSKAMKLNMHDVWLSRRKDFGIQRFWQVTGAERVFGGAQAFTSGGRRNSVTLRVRLGAMLIFGPEYWHTWFLWNKMSTISLGRDGCLIFSGVHLHLHV